MSISIEINNKEGIKIGDIVYLKKGLKKRYLAFLTSSGYLILSKDNNTLDESVLREDVYTEKEFNILNRTQKIKAILKSILSF